MGPVPAPPPKTIWVGLPLAAPGTPCPQPSTRYRAPFSPSLHRRTQADGQTDGRTDGRTEAPGRQKRAGRRRLLRLETREQVQPRGRAGRRGPPQTEAETEGARWGRICGVPEKRERSQGWGAGDSARLEPGALSAPGAQ